jgi:hypothetical protein
VDVTEAPPPADRGRWGRFGARPGVVVYDCPKRKGNGATLKRILLAVAALAVFVIPISIANAEVSQEFSFQLKDVKPDGRFTVVFTSRTFDTTGGIPPVLQENYLRLPAGAEIPRAFRKKKYYCDGSKLLSTLQANPQNNVLFFKRVENLGSLIKTLKKSRLASDRKALKNVETCKKVLIGKGDVQVDARPLINDLIPAKIYLFFGKGTAKGAVASFSILGVPDETAPVVRDNATVRNTRVVVAANFFKDPTPDGKYGYRLQLPAGPIGGINISIAEVNVVTKGLTITKKKTTCKKRKRGRCVKKKVKKTNLFWFTQPECPSSGKLSFASFYGYNDPQPDITKTIELSCPNFKR